MGLLLAVVLLVLGSCATSKPKKGTSPLKPPGMSPDSCVLDIFILHVPFGEEEANVRLWDEIDEQRLPNDLRRQLTRNGFRAGLVGGQVPPELARMLKLNDRPASSGLCQQVRFEQLDSAPTVVQHHWQVRPGQDRRICVSDVYYQWPVLRRDPAGVCGETYPNAQGVLALKTSPEPDGRVRLDLVPELHYGEPGQRVVGTGEGAFRLEPSRPRCVFDEMAVSVPLTSGEMVVLSCLPSPAGSLGRRFFTREDSGRQEQTLLLIRLSQTQHDGQFGPGGALPRGRPARSFLDRLW
jgi:hypothetical protein